MMHLNAKFDMVSNYCSSSFKKKINWSFHANKTKYNMSRSQSSRASTSIFFFSLREQLSVWNRVCLVRPFPSSSSIHSSILSHGRWSTPGHLIIPQLRHCHSVKIHRWLQYSLMRNLSAPLCIFSFHNILAGMGNLPRAACCKRSEGQHDSLIWTWQRSSHGLDSQQLQQADLSDDASYSGAIS